MNAILERLLAPQTWTATSWVLLMTTLAAALLKVLRRPSFSDRAPKLWTGDDWPILGATRFYTARHDMIRDGQETTETGNVSFYLGTKQVVSVSGSVEARKTFFDSKDLNFNQGYANHLLVQIRWKGRFSVHFGSPANCDGNHSR